MPAVPVEVEYHCFELSPDTPVDFDGSTADYLARTQGLPADQVVPCSTRDRDRGRVGLRLRLRPRHHTNTVLAHELLHAAKAQGRQLETAEALFRAYFEQGRHVGRVDDLVELAGEVGLDTDEALAALESHQYLGAVHADQAQAVAYGIQGVPFFVIDGRYGVSGAQDAECSPAP